MELYTLCICAPLVLFPGGGDQNKAIRLMFVDETPAQKWSVGSGARVVSYYLTIKLSKFMLLNRQKENNITFVILTFRSSSSSVGISLIYLSALKLWSEVGNGEGNVDGKRSKTMSMVANSNPKQYKRLDLQNLGTQFEFHTHTHTHYFSLLHTQTLFFCYSIFSLIHLTILSHFLLFQLWFVGNSLTENPSFSCLEMFQSEAQSCVISPIVLAAFSSSSRPSIRHDFHPLWWFIVLLL